MKDLGTALKEHTRANKQKRQQEIIMTETTKRIPVVCKNQVMWEAYINDYLRHVDIQRISPYSFVNNGSVIFPIFIDYIDGLDKLRGLRIRKAIIYQCNLSTETWNLLLSRFGEHRPDIDIITRY